MDHQRIYKDMEEVGRGIDSWESTSIHSLEQCKSKARDIAHSQGKVEELEAHFRKLDETYLRTKAVNESKNQEWVANAESLSSTKSRTEDLKKMRQILNERRHEREMIISEQLTALTMLEESNQPDMRFKRGHQEAVTWYNRALGFRIECGHGIKFIFVNVDQVSPAREFSFSIRHCRRNDSYTLLDCDPSFEGSSELLDELNRTNDLFKFVRVMRKKFQGLSLKGGQIWLTLTTVGECDGDSVTLGASSIIGTMFGSNDLSTIGDNDCKVSTNSVIKSDFDNTLTVAVADLLILLNVRGVIRI